MECSERYRATAEMKKWSAYPGKSASAFKVNESEWKELFCSPSIPAAAKDKLTAVGAMDSKGRFSSKDKKAFDVESSRLTLLPAWA